MHQLSQQCYFSYTIQLQLLENIRYQVVWLILKLDPCRSTYLEADNMEQCRIKSAGAK